MKKLILPATDRHIAIYDQDWSYINTNWGKAGGGRSQGLAPVGAANLIRSIVHKFVLDHQDLIARRMEEILTSSSLAEGHMEEEE